MPAGCCSLVRIAAMPDAMDGDGIGGLVEQDAVVADAKPEQTFAFSREPLLTFPWPVSAQR
jgi:hypothetical protein